MLTEDLQLVEDTDVCNYKPVCIITYYYFYYLDGINVRF